VLNHHELKVGIDTSPLVLTRAGTARHVEGLLGALRGRPGLDLVGLSAGGSGRLASVRRDAVWYPLRLGRASAGLDVLHCTTFRAPLRPRAPLVVTVHDLALLRQPEAFPRWHRATGTRALRAGVSAADAIVCVSAFTRDELVELLEVPPERIRIVPNAVDPVFTPAGERVDGDYVLAVGTLEPRKNLDAAIEAARLAGVELRVAGAVGWGGVQADGWLGEPSDEELGRFLEAEHEVWRPARQLGAHTHSLLDALRERGLKVGLVSNAWDPDWLLREDLEAMGLTDRLDAAVFSSVVGKRKPHPEIFERALADVAVPAERALFVGDSRRADVGGAAALGMTTVQAFWFRADPDDRAPEPDWEAFTPMDVLNIVRRLTGES